MNLSDAPQQASLFLPCLADLFYPSIGRATIKVLKRAGLKVSYPPDQTCCGQWAMNMGQTDAARTMARHFIAVFKDSPAVVSPSASCVLTVKKHYPELLAGDRAARDLAESVGARTYELTDFLVRVVGRTDLGAALSVKATLHDSCHPLRGLGIKEQPRQLLAQVKGLELVEMDEPEMCCGFGGAFMAKYAPLSRALTDDKINQALDTGADLLVMTEPGCLLNVDSAIKDRNVALKAMHLVEVLARGLEDGDGRP